MQRRRLISLPQRIARCTQQQTRSQYAMHFRCCSWLASKTVYNTLWPRTAHVQLRCYRGRDEQEEIRPKVSSLTISGTLRVKDLAQQLGIPCPAILEKLPRTYTMDDELPLTLVEDICYEFEVEPIYKEFRFADITPFKGKEPKDAPSRPPVVTVMGHVDHGKTTLLDTIRHTNVAAKEAGGITQHIGAFEVKIDTGDTITFIDTPGHEAFISMRAAGAQVTDIIVLVIAADDGVMPQTVEVIQHAKAAGVPIIVALNKCDKPSANTEKVKTQLLYHEIIPESLGGDVQMVEISGLTGAGIDKLMEAILLQADALELRASQKNVRAEATIIESRIDKALGTASTAIVKRGVLQPGQWLVIGNQYGRVRFLRDFVQKEVKTASPAKPVEIYGLSILPKAGELVLQVDNETTAKHLVENRIRQQQLQQRNDAAEDLYKQRVIEADRLDKLDAEQARISRAEKASEEALALKKKKDELMAKLHQLEAEPIQYFDEESFSSNREMEEEEEEEEGEEEEGDSGPKITIRKINVREEIMRAKRAKILREIRMQEQLEKKRMEEERSKTIFLIIKADAQGTLTAVHEIIGQFPKDEVSVKIVNEGIGQVNEGDIDLAKSVGALVIGMNVKPKPAVSSYAKAKGVAFESYRVIYHFIDYLKDELTKILPEMSENVVLGKATCKQIFEISGKNKEIIRIAGSIVNEGSFSKAASFVRVIRQGRVVCDDAQLLGLRHHKDEVSAIKLGQECGISISFNDVRPGDLLVAVEKRVTQRTFDSVIDQHKQVVGHAGQTVTSEKHKQTAGTTADSATTSTASQPSKPAGKQQQKQQRR